MISKNPEQRQQYDARLKFQRDEAARLESALNEGIEKGRVEGLKEGIEKGQLLGRIAILQELLSVTGPSCDELSSYNEPQLSELVEQLKEQLRSRGT